jgi:high-affinity Fe2+/Pb2+ permease
MKIKEIKALVAMAFIYGMILGVAIGFVLAVFIR